MKRLILIAVAVLMLAVPAFAQDMTPADEDTILWNATIDTITGLPMDPSEVTYNVWTKHIDGTNIQPVPNCQGIVPTTCTITYTVEGQYYQGVSTVRTVDGIIKESTISWSDDPTVVEGGVTFGTIFYDSPKNPVGLTK